MKMFAKKCNEGAGNDKGVERVEEGSLICRRIIEIEIHIHERSKEHLGD